MIETTYASVQREISRAQLATVVLALALTTLTFFLPVALVALTGAARLPFGLGAEVLRYAHELEPGAFSAGFYLATLILIGTGGCQVVQSARGFRERRRLGAHIPESTEDEEPSRRCLPRQQRNSSGSSRRRRSGDDRDRCRVWPCY